MYCSSCGESANRTATACPECGGALVETRPGPAPDPTIQLTSILATGDHAVIAIARSLLDAEGIQYVVRAEGLQDLFGWGRVGAGYNIVAGPAEFVVREEDAQRARDLLADLQAPSDRDDTQKSGDV